MRIDWDSFRKEDGSINLPSMFNTLNSLVSVEQQLDYVTMDTMSAYLSIVSTIRPITSRQVAAVALASAMFMGKMSELMDDEEPTDDDGPSDPLGSKSGGSV